MKNNRHEGNTQRNFRDTAELTAQPAAAKGESNRRGGDKKKGAPGKTRASNTGTQK